MNGAKQKPKIAFLIRYHNSSYLLAYRDPKSLARISFLWNAKKREWLSAGAERGSKHFVCKYVRKFNKNLKIIEGSYNEWIDRYNDKEFWKTGKG